MTAAQEVVRVAVMEPFATIARAETHARGWSFSELARRSDVPQASLSDYLNDKRMPPFDAVVRIAKALGLSLDVLAGWHESPAGLTEDERDVLKIARTLGPERTRARLLLVESPTVPGVQPDRVYVTGGNAQQPGSPAQGNPRRRKVQ